VSASAWVSTPSGDEPAAGPQREIVEPCGQPQAEVVLIDPANPWEVPTKAFGVASALMGFLRRFLGSQAGTDPQTNDAADLDAEERQHELDVLRGEQERLDELAQRQLRYAQYAWQPPAQGGERRADDRDGPPA
jgi:hypothetical protein